jgi:hypothetical protein|tara:strand:+ start:3904 stop:4254 length:351 start_codon:yes stop_codon:yes gene_type:complete
MNTLNLGVSQIEKSEDREYTCCQLLAKAVIHRAFMDSFGKFANTGYCGRSERSTLVDSAKNWFIDKRKNFILLCDIAGLNSDYVSEQFEKVHKYYRKGKLKNVKLNKVVSVLIQDH